MISISGEFVDGETGEEKPFYGKSKSEVANMVRRMKDGDSLVLNASEERGVGPILPGESWYTTLTGEQS